MPLMRLNDDGTTRRQRRCRVAARDRIRQREIARAEHNHRPKRHHHRTQIRLRQRLAVGIGMIYPRTGAQPARRRFAIQAHLETRPRQFALQPRHRQPRLLIGTFDNCRSIGL